MLATEDFVQATIGVRGFAYPHVDLLIQGAILGNSASYDQVLEVVQACCLDSEQFFIFLYSILMETLILVQVCARFSAPRPACPCSHL